MTTPSSSRKSVRLKPAGWLAIAVLAVIIVGGLGVLLQPVTHQPVSLTSIMTPLPTWTKVPTVTPVPSATPLPAGWTQQRSVDGRSYFALPADIEAQIQVALTAVLSCNYVEDASDTALKQLPDKSAACDQAQQAAGNGFTVWQLLRNGREIDTFGPSMPAQCQSTTSCTLTRAKLGIKGVLITTAADCRKMNATVPCVYRGSVKGPEPYELLIATVSLENGQWKVTHLDAQKLPGPPPAP
jgi:hypothetical protein